MADEKGLLNIPWWYNPLLPATWVAKSLTKTPGEHLETANTAINAAPEMALTMGTGMAQMARGGTEAGILAGTDPEDRPMGIRGEDGSWVPSIMGNVPATPADLIGYRLSQAYQPRTESGQAGMQWLGDTFTGLSQPFSMGMETAISKGVEWGLPASAIGLLAAGGLTALESVPGPGGSARRTGQMAARTGARAADVPAPGQSYFPSLELQQATDNLNFLGGIAETVVRNDPQSQARATVMANMGPGQAQRGGPKFTGAATTVGPKGFDYHNPSPEHQAVIAVGDTQRGAPEIAMRRAQDRLGGGVMNVLVEHVGDLTHRMTERTAFANGDMGFEFVKPKVDRALNMLRNRYGVEREFKENVANNIKYAEENPQYGPVRTMEDIDQALAQYGVEHSQVPVYNEMQRAARDAAIALGDKDFKKATRELEKLERVLNDGKDAWVQEASKFDRKYDHNSIWNKQRGMADTEVLGEGGKKVLGAQTTRSAPGLLNAEDRPRIPEYEAAEQPTPKAKARSEFSGAPKNSPLLGGRDVESVADEQILIDHYLSQAEAGVDGRLWYDEISQRFDRDVGNVSGARPGAADQQAAVFGHFSAGTAVPPNRLAQIRANNQFATGNPIEAGTAQRNADALQTYSESAVNPGTKLKTGLFGMQTRGIPTSRGTHDFRDAINWGFDVTDSASAGKVIGEAQHRWMDDMADRAVAEANKRKLGGYDDWTWDRLQAAGWVKQKADAKGVSVAEMANELQATDDWLRANVYHEAIPSKELIEFDRMDEPEKIAYTIQYAQKSANPEGQNVLAHQTGLLSPEQTRFVGEWEGNLTPNIVTTIMADPAKAANVMSSWSDEAVRFNGALNGLLGGQADVAYSFLRPEKILGSINSYRVPVGRSVTEADLTSYAKTTRQKMKERDAYGNVVYNKRSDGELEVTYLETFPDDYEKGTREYKRAVEWQNAKKLADEAKGLKAKDRTKEQKAAIKLVNDEKKLFRETIESVSNDRAMGAVNSGGLITWQNTYKPSEWLKHLQNPKMRQSVEGMLPKIAADIRRDINSLPLTKKGKEIYGKTLQLIEKGGLAAVEAAVKRGELPAAVIGALLFGASQVPEQPGQGQGLLQPMTSG